MHSVFGKINYGGLKHNSLYLDWYCHLVGDSCDNLNVLKYRSILKLFYFSGTILFFSGTTFVAKPRNIPHENLDCGRNKKMDLNSERDQRMTFCLLTSHPITTCLQKINELLSLPLNFIFTHLNYQIYHPKKSCLQLLI